jgi:hypothetical protein
MTDKFQRLVKLHQATGKAITSPGTCLVCGAKIYPSRSAIAQGKKITHAYCSRKCATVASGLRRRKVDLEKVRARYAKDLAKRKWGAQTRVSKLFGISREYVRQVVSHE